MNWEAIGIGISAAVAILMANAWLMKMVMKAAIAELGKIIAEEYVTKKDFERHIDTCPVAARSSK